VEITDKLDYTQALKCHENKHNVCQKASSHGAKIPDAGVTSQLLLR